MRTAKQIRSDFIEFFKTKQHTFVPSSPIVPIGDDTLLFANAGMNQFKDIFLGLRQPDCPRAVNSQKCLRVSGKHNDLEEVGKDTYHHTFFEMLGNWSFADYFKAEAIAWAWELFTRVWGMDASRLWATVFAGDENDGLPKDDEAARLWKQSTPLPAERILSFGRKDNFWEMGQTGPCGPCSEIHIDLGPDACDMKDVPGHKCWVNGGCRRFIELWNLVFIQYNRQSDGRLVPLSAKYVDTGAGLERIVAALQGKSSNYDTDLFTPIIERTAQLTGHKYTGRLGNQVDNAFRVIADHVRAVIFAVTDNAKPSNEGRGYVIRRILRRASRFGRELDMHEPFIYKLVPVVVDCLGDAFPEIKSRADYVATVIESEEASFGRTLDRGIEIFADAADRAARTPQKTISGDDAFQLYDTYGFPLDLTQLMAQEQGLKVDLDRFDALMKEQRERARKDRELRHSAADSVSVSEKLNVSLSTEDVHKYLMDRCDATIRGWIVGSNFDDEGSIPPGAEVGLVLDKTCFYAEAGGQVGDKGIVESSESRFIVEKTTKQAGDIVVHWGRVAQGTFAVGQKVTATVSKDRNATRKNHTATHLLQWALQQVLGKSVAQQGSYVCPEYLRFDFTCQKAPTSEQLGEVERLVNDKIAADLRVTWTILPREQADKLGAMALFGEKYGSEVRVICLGAEREDRINDAFSREFCGGTHVDRLGVIGGFKIIKEESISAGVRRITALTGSALQAYLEKANAVVDQLVSLLEVPSEAIVDRVTQLIADNKKLSKELKAASRQTGPDTLAEARALLEGCDRIGDACIVIGRLSATSVERAREAIDMLKKKAGSAAIVLGCEDDGKAMLLAGVTDDLVKRGLKAGEIVRKIAPMIEGGGGGRPQLAEAGGKNPQKIDEALAKAKDLISQTLSG
jgi:alanyl-tRNA synthetase